MPVTIEERIEEIEQQNNVTLSRTRGVSLSLEQVQNLASVELLAMRLEDIIAHDQIEGSEIRVVEAVLEELDRQLITGQYIDKNGDKQFVSLPEICKNFSHKLCKLIHDLDIVTPEELVRCRSMLQKTLSTKSKRTKCFFPNTTRIIDQLCEDKFLGISVSRLGELKRTIDLWIDLEYYTYRLKYLDSEISKIPDGVDSVTAKHVEQLLTAANATLRMSIETPNVSIETRTADIIKLLDDFEPRYFVKIEQDQVEETNLQRKLTWLGVAVAWFVSARHYILSTVLIAIVFLILDSFRWNQELKEFLILFIVGLVTLTFLRLIRVETPYFSVHRYGEVLSSPSECLFIIAHAIFSIFLGWTLARWIEGSMATNETVVTTVCSGLFLLLVSLILFGCTLSQSRLQILCPLDRARYRHRGAQELRLLATLPEASAGSIFNGADHSGKSLRGLKLTGLKFLNCRFFGTDFSKADLTGAIFVDCGLREAKFTDTVMRRTKFQDCKGLAPDQFKGALLAGCCLPRNLRLPPLKEVNQAMSEVAKIGSIVLIACLYTCSVLATTNDTTIILDKGSLELPIISQKASVYAFFFAAPVLLLIMFGYLELSAQKLWQRFVAIPAEYPDGTSLQENGSNWLLSSIALESMPRREPPSWLTFLSSHLTTGLLSFVAPLTIMLITLRYLPNHTPLLSLGHAIASGIAFFIGWFSMLTAKRTLEQRETHAAIDMTDFRNSAGLSLFAVIVISAAILTACFGRGTQISTFYANLESENVAERPKEWSERPVDKSENGPTMFRKIPTVDMSNRNLRLLKGQRVFLANADLTNSRLEMADLTLARLHGAILVQAHLENSFLIGANLSECEVYGANFESAHMKGATLCCLNKKQIRNLPELDGFQRQEACSKADDIAKEPYTSTAQLPDNQDGSHGLFMSEGSNLIYRTNFNYCDLSECDLSDSNLDTCCFMKAVIAGCNFSGANLRWAYFVACVSDPARTDATADSRLSFEGANLFKADFNYAKLYGASFQRAILTCTRFDKASFTKCDFRNAIGLDPKAILKARITECLFSPDMKAKLRKALEERGAPIVSINENGDGNMTFKKAAH